MTETDHELERQIDRFELFLANQTRRGRVVIGIGYDSKAPASEFREIRDAALKKPAACVKMKKPSRGGLD